MDVKITVTLSGEGADLRALLAVEDAILKAMEATPAPGPGALAFVSAYPHHRNGSVGVVLTAGNPPERKPRIKGAAQVSMGAATTSSAAPLDLTNAPAE